MSDHHSNQKCSLAELLEQARKWPNESHGEGFWFNAMADVMEAQRDTALARDREIERLRESLRRATDFIGRWSAVFNAEGKSVMCNYFREAEREARKYL